MVVVVAAEEKAEEEKEVVEEDEKQMYFLCISKPFLDVVGCFKSPNIGSPADEIQSRCEDNQAVACGECVTGTLCTVERQVVAESGKPVQWIKISSSDSKQNGTFVCMRCCVCPENLPN